MKFYRVSYLQDGGNSGGFSWHSNRQKAERQARQAVENDPKEYDMGPPSIDIINVIPTKVGILDALNRHASEPQNG